MIQTSDLSLIRVPENDEAFLLFLGGRCHMKKRGEMKRGLKGGIFFFSAAKITVSRSVRSGSTKLRVRGRK